MGGGGKLRFLKSQGATQYGGVNIQRQDGGEGRGGEGVEVTMLLLPFMELRRRGKSVVPQR